MNSQFIVRSFAGMALLLAAASLAFAQHGGGHGGGGHGGGGHGGGGHGGGGHGGGGHGGGHFGGYSGGHGGGHSGRHGGGYSGGHGGGHGYGHYGGHGGYGHYGYFYPHFDFYVSPWYGGYGYSSYSPVYYSGSYSTGYHSAERVSTAPVYVAQAEPSPTQQLVDGPVTTPQGEAYQRKAEEAFRAGDFQRAARLANHALVEMPRHGKLLLFTAQTFFAIGDYRRAAAAIHQAASQLDSEQWGHVVENARRYYRGHAFVDQMDRLNEYIKKNPNADYAYFLRGYEHGFLGHHQTAMRDLNKAVELESRDKLAAQLIERFGGTPPATADQPALESNSTADPGPSPAVPDNGDEQLPETTKTKEHADGHAHAH